jgi:hypothetical protein
MGHAHSMPFLECAGMAWNERVICGQPLMAVSGSFGGLVHAAGEKCIVLSVPVLRGGVTISIQLARCMFVHKVHLLYGICAVLRGMHTGSTGHGRDLIVTVTAHAAGHKVPADMLEELMLTSLTVLRERCWSAHRGV